MIIDGHPDILLGPRGLNGLHGFGSLPPEGSSPAYIRFLPEKGGAGIEALYQEIRDFINTPGRTDAEIEQAKMASGVSDRDVQNAFQVPGEKIVDTKEDYITYPPDNIYPNASPAYTRFLPENGGKGIDALYQEIRDFITARTSNTESSYAEQQKNKTEIEQAMFASGVTDQDVANAFAQPLVDTKEDFTFEQFCPPGSMLVNGVCVGDPSTYSPDTNAAPSAQEIRDFVSTNSDAEILAAMARSGVTQSDIIRAFREVDAALATGQSPAFTRYLPENGGLGLEALYKEINDYASTHSLYELLAQMQRSGVSMKDVDAANSYAFGQQQSQAPAEYAAAEQAASQEKQRLEEQNFFRLQTERRARLDAEAAAAAAAKQAAIAAQAAQAQQALNATLAARAAASAAAAAKEAAAQSATAAASTAATKATAAATAAAASAATAAAVVVASTPGQSPAYTRFLPENGGKGVTALYKEISDFVDTHSNAEIQTAMTASGVSEVDVIKALQVFPNKAIVKTTQTATTATSGLTFPLILSAIAAYFVLG